MRAAPAALEPDPSVRSAALADGVTARNAPHAINRQPIRPVNTLLTMTGPHVLLRPRLLRGGLSVGPGTPGRTYRRRACGSALAACHQRLCRADATFISRLRLMHSGADLWQQNGDTLVPWPRGAPER